MLLKTNKREEDGVLLVGYIIEKKLLRGIIRQVKSILMNMQEIAENSTADGRQITEFSSAKCEKGRLIHEFSRRPGSHVCLRCLRDILFPARTVARVLTSAMPFYSRASCAHLYSCVSAIPR